MVEPLTTRVLVTTIGVCVVDVDGGVVLFPSSPDVEVGVDVGEVGVSVSVVESSSSDVDVVLVVEVVLLVVEVLVVVVGSSSSSSSSSSSDVEVDVVVVDVVVVDVSPEVIVGLASDGMSEIASRSSSCRGAIAALAAATEQR